MHLIQMRDCFVDKQACAQKSIKNYLYSSETPFKTKEIETSAILKILHDIKILKSGGLALRRNGKDINRSKYAYEEFKKLIEETAPKSCDAYFDNIVRLQGEIRSYRDGLKGFLRQFSELGEGNEAEIPEELDFYSPIGFHRVIVLEENKKFRMNWAAFSVFILGVLQVIAGCILCSIGLPNFGNALISEGVSDMVQGMIGMITGQFSLTDWATSKAISLTVSLLAGGLQFLKHGADTCGKLTKIQKFYKAVAKVCVDLTMQVGGELISRHVIGELMAFANDSISESLKPAIKKELNFEPLKIKLKELRRKKGISLF